MRQFKRNNDYDELLYKKRIFFCVIVVQVLLILFIKFWPSAPYAPDPYQDEIFQDQIVMEEIQITRQESAPPPPPRPMTPIPVPNDEIIEVELEIIDDLDLMQMELPLPAEGTGRFGDRDVIVSNPQLPPTVIRIVEASVPPNVPKELKDKLEFIVNFLVDPDGNVEEVSIVEIRMYTTEDEYEVLPFIDHGLMDAILKATMEWKFRPARNDGQRVRSYTRQRFFY